MKITLPKWHEEARKLRDNGMTLNQIALIMKESGIEVSPSRVGQVVSPSWERYSEINTLKLKALKEEVSNAKREGRLPDTKTAVREAMLSFRQKEVAMADRYFEQAFAGVTDKNGVRIRCSEKGCHESMIFSRKGMISPVHAARWFRDKGWFVGHNEKFDLCPDHYHPKKDEVPVQKHININVPTGDEMKANPELSSTTAIPTEPIMKPIIKREPIPVPAENGADREMSRMDKRTIHLKLEEVYIDEEIGYRKDWDDEKVAVNLGVPREWVAVIREDSFGPEVSSSRKEKLETLAQNVSTKAEAIQQEFVEIGQLISEVDARWEVIDKRMEAFEQTEKDFTALMQEFYKERDKM